MIACLELLPPGLAEGQHVVAQSCINQRVSQVFGRGLGGSDGQQVDIGVGIPVTPGQGAKQPHLAAAVLAQQGRDSLAQLGEAGEAALLANGSQS